MPSKHWKTYTCTCEGNKKTDTVRRKKRFRHELAHFVKIYYVGCWQDIPDSNTTATGGLTMEQLSIRGETSFGSHFCKCGKPMGVRGAGKGRVTMFCTGCPKHLIITKNPGEEEGREWREQKFKPIAWAPEPKAHQLFFWRIQTKFVKIRWNFLRRVRKIRRRPK